MVRLWSRLQLLSCDVQDIESICRVLSAILNLGDIDLAEVEPHHRDTVSYITNRDLAHTGQYLVFNHAVLICNDTKDEMHPSS